jgi:hypothetical protein
LSSKKNNININNDKNNITNTNPYNLYNPYISFNENDNKNVNVSYSNNNAFDENKFNTNLNSLIEKNNKNSKKNILREYILKKEIKYLKDEILNLSKNPIELKNCSFLDPLIIKEYSDVENQIIFIENIISSQISDLKKLKENLISNLIIRKDFFDEEKKKSENLMKLLKEKNKEFTMNFQKSKIK